MHLSFLLSNLLKSRRYPKLKSADQDSLQATDQTVNVDEDYVVDKLILMQDVNNGYIELSQRLLTYAEAAEIGRARAASHLHTSNMADSVLPHSFASATRPTRLVCKTYVTDNIQENLKSDAQYQKKCQYKRKQYLLINTKRQSKHMTM